MLLIAGLRISALYVVVLHLPGSAGWLTHIGGAHAVLLCCLHSFLFPSALLSSSVIFIMVLAAFFQFFHIFLEYFLVFDVLPASFFYYWACLEDVFLGLCFFFAESAYEVSFTSFFKIVFHWQHGCSCPYYGRAFFLVQFFHIYWSLVCL